MGAVISRQPKKEKIYLTLTTNEPLDENDYYLPVRSGNPVVQGICLLAVSLKNRWDDLRAEALQQSQIICLSRFFEVKPITAFDEIGQLFPFGAVGNKDLFRKLDNRLGEICRDYGFGAFRNPVEGRCALQEFIWRATGFMSEYSFLFPGVGLLSDKDERKVFEIYDIFLKCRGDYDMFMAKNPGRERKHVRLIYEAVRTDIFIFLNVFSVIFSERFALKGGS